MFYLICCLVFILVIIGILIIIESVRGSRFSDICENQEEINSQMNDHLKKSNFNITKKLYLNDFATYDQSNDCKKFIAIDNDNKKICLIDYKKGKMLIIEFNELLNYEIYENGSNLITGGSVGGFGLGIFGAEMDSMCKDLTLIIRLKSYDTFQISYEIISNTRFNIGISKSTQPYKQCISTLQEVVSFFEVIKNENNTKKD